MLVAVQSCSTDSDYEGSAGKDMRKRVLTMDLSLSQFSEAASRAGASFSNGAKVYIDFGGIKGTAVYDGSQWTIEYPDELAETNSANCSVVYVENPSSASTSSVSLSSSSIVYQATGKYKNTLSEMSVEAALAPATSRVRFRGTSGTSVTVKGLKRYQQFNISTFGYTDNTADLSLTVKSDGYTDYVYGLFASSGRSLTIVNNDITYTRTFGSNVMQAGHSGYIDIPTESSYSGWSTDKQQTNATISGTDYDSSDSNWNQEDPEPGQSINTPVNGYDGDENWNATVHNGHEYVDLGLSVKWATMNVGALKPEGYGHYFAWGEIYSKTDYSWLTYKWCNGSSKTMTKYCTSTDYWDSSLGTSPDNKTVLDPEDDVAHVKWGGSWRMPTFAEQDELRNKCSWKWTSQGGVQGYVVTGPNGNSIFLPAAGYRSDSGLYGAGLDGYYWSSSLNDSEDYSDDACYLYFYSSRVGWNDRSRYYGQSVRAVCP